MNNALATTPATVETTIPFNYRGRPHTVRVDIATLDETTATLLLRCPQPLGEIIPKLLSGLPRLVPTIRRSVWTQAGVLTELPLDIAIWPHFPHLKTLLLCHPLCEGGGMNPLAPLAKVLFLPGSAEMLDSLLAEIREAGHPFLSAGVIQLKCHQIQETAFLPLAIPNPFAGGRAARLIRSQTET